MKVAVPFSVGTSALASPVWLSWINPAWQGLLAILGLIVLILTIWSKVLEIKQRKKALRSDRGKTDQT